MKTLDGTDMKLNDNIMNFYLEMIVQRSLHDSKFPRVFAMNTYFFKKLSEKGYDGVKRWNKAVDLFFYNMIFGKCEASYFTNFHFNSCNLMLMNI